MKKTLFTLGLLAAFGMAISSCSKCVTCGSCPDGITMTDDAGNDVSEKEICQKDAASKDEYEQGIAVIEAFGCTCK